MKELTDIEGLETCLNASNEGPVVIFKHSTSCSISASAYEAVRRFLSQPPDDCPEFYLVKVIESRPVSNEIASRLGVQHKSPQIILVKEGQPQWSASHHGIHADAITSAIKAERG